jgi:hypothetical protein
MTANHLKILKEMGRSGTKNYCPLDHKIMNEGCCTFRIVSLTNDLSLIN